MLPAIFKILTAPFFSRSPLPTALFTGFFLTSCFWLAPGAPLRAQDSECFMESAEGEVIDLGDLCRGSGPFLPDTPSNLGPATLPDWNNPYDRHAPEDPFAAFANPNGQTEPGIPEFSIDIPPDPIAAGSLANQCQNFLSYLNQSITTAEQLEANGEEMSFEQFVALITQASQDLQTLPLADPQLLTWRNELLTQYQMASFFLQGFEQIVEELAQGLVEGLAEGLAAGFGAEVPDSFQWEEGDFSLEAGSGETSIDAAPEWEYLRQIETYCANP